MFSPGGILVFYNGILYIGPKPANKETHMNQSKPDVLEYAVDAMVDGDRDHLWHHIKPKSTIVLN